MDIDQWTDLGLFVKAYPTAAEFWFDKVNPEISIVIQTQTFRDNDLIFFGILVRYARQPHRWRQLYAGHYTTRDEAERVVMYLILRGASHVIEKQERIESVQMDTRDAVIF